VSRTSQREAKSKCAGKVGVWGATERNPELWIPNVEFIVMPSRVGERARGAGFNSGRLGIIRASSGTEAACHRPGIVLFFDLRTPFF
jgi:hypothetical protein